MTKQEFLKMFAECLKDESIQITAEHDNFTNNSDEWNTTNIGITILFENEPQQHFNFKGA